MKKQHSQLWHSAQNWSLVLWSYHPDYLRYSSSFTSGLVCSPFLEVSSWNCSNVCHGSSLGIMQLNSSFHLVGISVSIGQFIGFGSEYYLESPLDCKEIKLIHPKGNQPWILIGRTAAEAEAPKLWPPDAKSQLIGKDPDFEKDWGQGGEGVTEDEVVGWHHWLNVHKFE